MSTDPELPRAAAYRAIQEILRTFRDSGWSAMTVELQGVRIAVGKHGPPAGSAVTVTSAPPAPDERRSAPTASAAPPVPAAAPPTTAPAEPSTSSAPSTAGVDLDGCVAARSPAVGAFWTAPSPGRPAFVDVGHVVARDDQLAIVEVMKLMNPVVAPVDGTVVAVCAANSDLVEYEQVLFWIRPSDG